MIFVDLLSMKFRNVKLRERNPKCVACGDCENKITDVSTFDYDTFAGVKCASKYALIKLAPENNISPSEMVNEINKIPEG